jgi:small-conductance mechanosensitive channel/CRP-like cAMP-binding protein
MSIPPISAALQHTLSEAYSQGTALILGGYLVARFTQGAEADAHAQRARRKLELGLLVFHTLLLPVTGVCAWLGAGFARDLRLTGSIAGALAGVLIYGQILFGAVFPRLHIGIAGILQDVIVAVVAAMSVFITASRVGIDLTGIVATGAVLTGVIGLALQDLLGNVFGGLSLQLDHTIRVGDWIQIENVIGRVVEMRWRSTSIETRAWETVIIPNSVLTRTQVMVLGRRQSVPREPSRWRRQVEFEVDFRYPPNQVMDCVQEALRGHPIDNVASTPPPVCVLRKFEDDNAGRYEVRYWLLDVSQEAPVDSVVLTRVFYALKRHDIPLSMPAHTVFMTEESRERKVFKIEREQQRRMDALAHIGLFRDLSEAERGELANGLTPAPFARGEVLTLAGAQGHDLYVITSGTVSVRADDGVTQTEMAKLGAGEFFGEMSLLTGAPRSATIVALTDVDCYRLDAEVFKGLLESRPDLAERVAKALNERRTQLQSYRPAGQPRSLPLDMSQGDLLNRIRGFFRI